MSKTYPLAGKVVDGFRVLEDPYKVEVDRHDDEFDYGDLEFSYYQARAEKYGDEYLLRWNALAGSSKGDDPRWAYNWEHPDQILEA